MTSIVDMTTKTATDEEVAAIEEICEKHLDKNDIYARLIQKLIGRIRSDKNELEMSLFNRIRFIVKSYYNSFRSSPSDSDFDSFDDFVDEDLHPIRTPPHVLAAFAKLGLKDSATRSDAHKKYIELMKEHHPDKHKDNQESATKIAQEITKAYEILKTHFAESKS